MILTERGCGLKCHWGQFLMKFILFRSSALCAGFKATVIFVELFTVCSGCVLGSALGFW